ncbi:CrcB protein [Alteribacillus persepolensis]|uniref:Fluoride-specific ion channel FluC n=1 Tax=Alteribacillus persepolensis TaxID=568899 RepID=A0A1G8GDW0_9BACI|nr:fluoride efflux transporter CrcB [Alteribacillus persepolensis]SDH92568.1 CrcB protein [Alteribacillus persepolensis]
MTSFFFVAGGAAGAVCRYFAGKWISSLPVKTSFPIGMLAVNVIGSFGLGLFLGSVYGGIPLGAYEDQLYLFVAIGFFGAFTTFSTFSMETIQLLEKKQYVPLFVYVFLSVAGSLSAFLLGLVPFIS